MRGQVGVGAEAGVEALETASLLANRINRSNRSYLVNLQSNGLGSWLVSSSYSLIRTARSHLRQRAHLVLLLHEHPALSHVEVAARLDLHPNCVRRWRQRWAEGQFTLEDAPGRGRKPAFSPP